MVQVAFLIFLFSIVAAIGLIDIRSYRIPNVLNLSLFLAGIIFVLATPSMSILVQLFAAIAVFLLLWLIRFVHFRLRGEVGLGLGDVKMGAASSIWVFPENIPLLILIASSCALAVTLGARYFGTNFDDTINLVAFGPYIGLSLLVVWSIQTSVFGG